MTTRLTMQSDNRFPELFGSGCIWEQLLHAVRAVVIWRSAALLCVILCALKDFSGVSLRQFSYLLLTPICIDGNL